MSDFTRTTNVFGGSSRLTKDASLILLDLVLLYFPPSFKVERLFIVCSPPSQLRGLSILSPFLQCSGIPYFYPSPLLPVTLFGQLPPKLHITKMACLPSPPLFWVQGRPWLLYRPRPQGISRQRWWKTNTQRSFIAQMKALAVRIKDL